MTCALNELMTEEQIMKWILGRLGMGKVGVELTKCHLEIAIDTAKRWFVANKGQTALEKFDLIYNQVEYALPQKVEKVLEVWFPSNPLDLATVFFPFSLPDTQVPYNIWTNPQSMGVYSHYYQIMQYSEQAKRILSAEQEWQQEGRSLFIFPAKTLTGTVIYKYKSGCFTVEQLSERDHMYVKEYAFAIAMEILGRIRAKYPSGQPGANGDRALDGESLLATSAASIERLNEQIIQAGYPMGMVVG